MARPTPSGIEWHTRTGRSGLAKPALTEGDACFPFKKMVRNAMALLPQVDLLLVPRLVKLDGYLMCPNFRALPDLVVMNRDRLAGPGRDTRLLSPLVELDGPAGEAELFMSLHRAILSEETPAPPVAEPPAAVAPPACDDRTIVLIGHPYILRDPQLNLGLPEMIRAHGYRLLTPHGFDFAALDKLAARHDYYAKTQYWRGAREALGTFLHCMEHTPPAGIIFLLSFNCGVDALTRIELMSLHRQLNPKIPFMVLVGDEHSQREHVVTRLEAFMDVINGITGN